MVRFRIGQSWKREGARIPKDSFGLYVDGIDLLCGATEESLAIVVAELIDALDGLFLKGEVLAQVSLAEAHSELIFHRRDAGVEVNVVSLARPAQLARSVTIELAGLKEAAVACAHTLMKDLSEASPAFLRSTKTHRMTRKLLALEHASLPAPQNEFGQTGYSYRAVHGSECSFSFTLNDSEDLILQRGATAALPSLLCPGFIELWLPKQDQPAWEGRDRVFLMALELSRQASDLCQAIDLGETRFAFAPGGHPPELQIDLERNSAQTGHGECAVSAVDLARAMFHLGLAVTFAVTHRSKRQAKNPYLIELSDRCREGLALLRGSEPVTSQASAKGTRKLASAGRKRPLQAFGRLRRLRYVKSWEKGELFGKEPSRLLLSAQGPIVSSSEMACAFDAEGRLLYRRLGVFGVATSSDGYTLVVTPDRIAGFRSSDKSAEWIRDHDGSLIAPGMERKNGLLICQSEARSILAFSELTGRVVWRLLSQRARHVFLTLQGHRALVATEPGVLFGLDLKDGQIRFRLRAGPTLVGPAVSWGRKFLALAGRGDRHTLIAADAHGGSVQWTHPLTLSFPCSPLPLGHGVLIAGEGKEGGLLLRLNANGRPTWEEKLSLGRGPFALASSASSAVVCSRSGAASLVSEEGQLRWQIGPSGSDLPNALAPSMARGLLIIPGETVRVVNPADGEVLAEVKAGVGLCDLKVDSRLNLYLLDEEGTLKSYRLASHFALVQSLPAGER